VGSILTDALSPNTEIIGVLLNIEKNKEKNVLTFCITKKILIVEGSLQVDLKKYLGKKIGLINLGDTYRVREIKNSEGSQ
jgi:hypothetical protein